MSRSVVLGSVAYLCRLGDLLKIDAQDSFQFQKSHLTGLEKSLDISVYAYAYVFVHVNVCIPM